MKHKTHANYYTIRDVRELLQRGRTAIHKMIKDGRLPEPSKDGRLNVWKKSEFDRWIKLEKHLG